MWLAGKGLHPNEEVKKVSNAYFERIEASYYLTGTGRSSQCITIDGDHV